MAGLRKAKQYDWKDSNLALFGSDLEKNIKKQSAKGEPAWEGAGKKVGLQIWRIVDFKVTHWPKEQYGQFYNGDSYIILNTYKCRDSDELNYDVHFWIGALSSQDEYGTAAYKTVELDILLDDKPVQHRECQDFETPLFKSYFKTITVLNGGADSGFNKVGAERYETRLMEIKIENKKKYVKQVTLKKENMNNGDIYIFDMGLRLIQWQGKDASAFEKVEAGRLAREIDMARNDKVQIEVLDDQDVDDMPESLLALFREGGASDAGGRPPRRQPTEKKLFRLSDSSGSLQFEDIATGSAVKRSQLNSNDVFILDTEYVCYVWIGRGASIDEKKCAFQSAHCYMQRCSPNPYNPITVVDEGHESDDFNRAF